MRNNILKGVKLKNKLVLMRIINVHKLIYEILEKK